VRDKPPTQMTFDRPSRLRVPPVDKLWFVWSSLLIHESTRIVCNSMLICLILILGGALHWADSHPFWLLLPERAGSGRF
jgi:hypothetical protein